MLLNSYHGNYSVNCFKQIAFSVRLDFLYYIILHSFKSILICPSHFSFHLFTSMGPSDLLRHYVSHMIHFSIHVAHV